MGMQEASPSLKKQEQVSQSTPMQSEGQEKDFTPKSLQMNDGIDFIQATPGSESI